MGKIHELEREHVWGGVFGVGKQFRTARENFRPAVWRPITTKQLGKRAVNGTEINMTGLYRGLKSSPHYYGGDRRNWGIAGIVMPEPTEWQQMLDDNPEGRLMLVATFSKGVFMIGDLATRQDVGYATFNDQQLPAHAFRIGKGDVRFAMGVENSD